MTSTPILESAEDAQQLTEPASGASGVAEVADVVFSIIVCSIDSRKFNNVCADYRRLFRNTRIEIIGIHDARSLAEAYNRGIARARGEYIILSHDDIRLLTPDLEARLRAHLQEFDLVGVAGTKRVVGPAWFLAGYPHDYVLIISPFVDMAGESKWAVYIRGSGPLVVPGMQALDGVLLCMRRCVARDVGFDEVTFDHFHLYDLDFTYRAYLKGFKLGVCRDLLVLHESAGRFDKTWERYGQRFQHKFAGSLPRSWTKTESPLATIVVEQATLQDGRAIIKLADPATLQELVGRVGAPTAMKPV